MLSGKCVVLGVTGGIAAYKAAEIVSRLKKRGANVRVVMTGNAREFIAPLTFETLSANPVYTDSFEKAWEIRHISLAKSADLMLVAPATANIIGKLAHGIADDLLSTTLMAMPAPILFAPAMNAQMYRSAANQDNLRLLRSRGVRFIGPETGLLACGDDDIGRMSEPDTVVGEVIRLLCPRRDLEGRRVLVTAGPTREMIDPVRFLSNRSSGKMGYAIAEAARDRGALVTLVTGPVALAKPTGIGLIEIVSTLELYEAVTQGARDADAVIQAAAPADFRPLRVADQKIKKGAEDMALALTRNPDIAEALGKVKRPGQALVIFAAETNDMRENARGKLIRKNADLVVANDVTQEGAGFSVDTNRVTLIDREREEALPLMSKREVADKILDRVVGMMRLDAVDDE